jgi:hypothetical protein
MTWFLWTSVVVWVILFLFSCDCLMTVWKKGDMEDWVFWSVVTAFSGLMPVWALTLLGSR